MAQNRFKKFDIGVNDEFVKSTVGVNKSEILNFCLQNLNKKQCRDD